MYDIEGITYEGADLDQLDATLNKVGIYGTENLDDDAKGALLKEFLRTHNERKKDVNEVKNPTTGDKQDETKRQLRFGRKRLDIEKSIHERDLIPAVKTGYQELDEKVSFSKGTLSVFYAYSGHGKTSFMVQLMQRMMSSHSHEDYAFLYILFEDTTTNIEEKWLNAFKGTIVKKENNRIVPRIKTIDTIIDNYAENKSYSFEKANTPPVVVLEDLEKELIQPFKDANKNKTIVVFADYVQQIPTRAKYKGGFERIYEVSATLRDIAEKEGEELVMIAGVQANKDGGMRESDDIKQSASNIINIYNTRAGVADLDKGIKAREIKKERLQKFIETTSNLIYKPSVIILHIVKTRRTNGVGECDDVCVYDGKTFKEYYDTGTGYEERTEEVKKEHARLKKADIKTNAYGTGNVAGQSIQTDYVPGFVKR